MSDGNHEEAVRILAVHLRTDEAFREGVKWRVLSKNGPSEADIATQAYAEARRILSNEQPAPGTAEDKRLRRREHRQWLYHEGVRRALNADKAPTDENVAEQLFMGVRTLGDWRSEGDI